MKGDIDKNRLAEIKKLGKAIKQARKKRTKNIIEKKNRNCVNQGKIYNRSLKI